MNRSPADIVDLFIFVEVALIQYSMASGHLPRVTVANAKVRRKKVHKVEIIQEEPPKEEPQANAVTPRPKKGFGRGLPQTPPKNQQRQPPGNHQDKVAKAVARGRRESKRRGINSASLSFEATVKRAIIVTTSIRLTLMASSFHSILTCVGKRLNARFLVLFLRNSVVVKTCTFSNVNSTCPFFRPRSRK